MTDYSFAIKTSKTPQEVFAILKDIKQWWFGVFDETITGKSEEINDEFSFSAGGGVHFTKQKLVSLIPNSEIAWKVVESNLTFLSNPKEWEGTTLHFEITSTQNETLVQFIHKGLKPQIECYESCSTGWTSYFQLLQQKLK